MAFTVEDGTGLEDANAYIDEAFLAAYWADRGVTFAQPVPEQQIAIVRATDYIENEYGCQFEGCKVNPLQALSFPRTGLYDCEYNEVASDEVPKRVMEATAELARKVLDSPTTALLPDPSRDPSITKIREKVGPIEEETEFIPGSGGNFAAYPTVEAKLSDFLMSCQGRAIR